MRLFGSALLSLAVLAAGLLRLHRVARPERTLVASLDVRGARFEVHRLALRRPGAPTSHPLGWTLSCAGHQLAAGSDAAPTELELDDSAHGARVHACRGGRARLRARTDCVVVDPAHCLAVNPLVIR